jgi:hypothetical protein
MHAMQVQVLVSVMDVQVQVLSWALDVKGLTVIIP